MPTRDRGGMKVLFPRARSKHRGALVFRDRVRGRAGLNKCSATATKSTKERAHNQILVGVRKKGRSWKN